METGELRRFLHGARHRTQRHADRAPLAVCLSQSLQAVERGKLLLPRMGRRWLACHAVGESMRVCSDSAAVLMPALLHPAFVTGATCLTLHTRDAGLLMLPDMTTAQKGHGEGSSVGTHGDGA